MARSRSKAAVAEAAQDEPTDQRHADRAAEEAAQDAVAAAVEAAHADELPGLGAHPDGTVLVKPRGGKILADVPPEGTRMPVAAAEDWAAHGLVVIIEEPTGDHTETDELVAEPEPGADEEPEGGDEDELDEAEPEPEASSETGDAAPEPEPAAPEDEP